MVDLELGPPPPSYGDTFFSPAILTANDTVIHRDFRGVNLDLYSVLRNDLDLYNAVCNDLDPELARSCIVTLLVCQGLASLEERR